MIRGLQIDHNQINEFCRKWKIKEFSLFGSILRDDFRPDSDVDVLIEFLPEAQWSLLDWVRMIEELKAVFEINRDGPHLFVGILVEFDRWAQINGVRPYLFLGV
jgi:predicted nucleotidyltransferase